jgi:hypothetical protein
MPHVLLFFWSGQHCLPSFELSWHKRSSWRALTVGMAMMSRKDPEEQSSNLKKLAQMRHHPPPSRVRFVLLCQRRRNRWGAGICGQYVHTWNHLLTAVCKQCGQCVRTYVHTCKRSNVWATYGKSDCSTYLRLCHSRDGAFGIPMLFKFLPQLIIHTEAAILRELFLQYLPLKQLLPRTCLLPLCTGWCRPREAPVCTDYPRRWQSNFSVPACWRRLGESHGLTRPSQSWPEPFLNTVPGYKIRDISAIS